MGTLRALPRPVPLILLVQLLAAAASGPLRAAESAGPAAPATLTPPAVAPPPEAAPVPEAAPAPPPEIVLYTMGPGEDPFTRFGHAAICIRDQREARNFCYNYGTTDFTDPVKLTWDFLRGRARFWVAQMYERQMIDIYVLQDRSIWRQRLPLAPDQARALADALEATTLPESRYYQYHHFNDNCTTRIRDIIDRVVGGTLSRDRHAHGGPTFRAYAREGFAGDAPLLGATELLLGRSADERTSPWQAMFLPDVLRREVATRLRAPPEQIYARKGPPFEGSLLLGRLAVAALGLLWGALVILLGRRGHIGEATRGARALAGSLPGLLGAIMWALAFLSTFPELQRNEALLCLWPTDLLLPLLRGRVLRAYLALRLGALALVAVLWLAGALLQPLGAVLIFAAAPLAATWAAGRPGRRGIAPPSAEPQDGAVA